MDKEVISKGLIFVIIGLFIGASVVPISCANKKDTVYVNNDVDEKDYKDGSERSPYKTINDGIKYVGDRGTVCVCNGTYNELIYINKPLTLIGVKENYTKGNDKNGSIIEGIINENVIEIDNTNSVTISGFKIQNSGNGSRDAGIYSYRSSHCQIWNNILSNNSNGIIITESSNIYIYDMIIFNNLQDGIRIDCKSNNISIYNNNKISSCLGYGLYISDSKTVKIWNDNRIFSCIKDGIRITEKCSDIKIEDNKIYNCGQIHNKPNNTSGTGNGIKISDSNLIYINYNDINETMSGISVSAVDVSYDIFIQYNNLFECYQNGICIKYNSSVHCKYNNIFNNGLNFPSLGAGIYLTSDQNENLLIQYNYIHGNLYNVIMDFMLIKNNEQFTYNNITEPKSGIQFKTTASFVHAEHNYWARKNWLPLSERKIIVSFFKVFPVSDHPYWWMS